jgi:hypothetical protein
MKNKIHIFIITVFFTGLIVLLFISINGNEKKRNSCIEKQAQYEDTNLLFNSPFF